MCFLFKKTPNPTINPIGNIDLNSAGSILLDKLEEIGQDKAEIYMPDVSLKVYNKEEVKKCFELEEVSSIQYVSESFDCDDFAAELYGKFAGLVWTNVHALNWFIDDTNTFYFIEPQNKKIAEKLDSWQGTEIRFFLGR
jgi:hypothetical protein